MEKRIPEFKINDLLSLKLENNESMIYIDNKKFLTCKFLLLNIPVEDVASFDDIQSIDEAADQLDGSLHPRQNSMTEFQRVDKIPPEVEFWGHCSNLQVWCENDYNTRLLASNLAFPLLKKLTDAGDPLAKRVFNEEIAKRLDSGYLPVIFYLLTNDFLRYLSPNELMSLDMANNIRNMDDFKRYVEGITPKTGMEWLVKAQTFEMFRELEKKEQILKEGLEKYPNHVQLLMNYAKCFSERGEWDKVIPIIEKLISIDPSNADFVNTLGMTYEKLRNQKEALKCYEKAKELNANYLYPRFNLAVLHHHLGNVQQRDTVLNEIKALKVTDEKMMREVGGFCHEIGKEHLSIAFLKKSLPFSPEDCEVWMALALAYKDIAKPLHERRCLKKVISINADFYLTSTALNNMGIISIENNKYDKGVYYLEQSVKINPENEQSWANLSMANIGIFFIARSEISMEISKKLRDLEVYRNYNDVREIQTHQDQIELLKSKYWALEYECVFCHQKLISRTKFCTNCGAKLLLMEDMKKASPSEMEVIKTQADKAAKETRHSIPIGEEFKQYANRNLGISFVHPVNWMIDSLPGTTSVVVMNNARSQEFHESVAIMVIPGIRATLKEYSKDAINRLKTTLKEFKVLEKPSRIKVANSPAVSVTFKGIQQNHLIKLKSIQTIKNQIAYSITYFADVNRFDKSLPIFEEMLNSLKVFKPENLAVNPVESLQSNFARNKPPIDIRALNNDINYINPQTPISKIKQIMEGFMLATIMTELKGFGPLAPSFAKFTNKLNQNGLLQKLDSATIRDLDLLKKISETK